MSKDCNSLRIFVVDDEYVISSTLASIFCLHGFDATGFVEPFQALRAAREQAPDLLLTDIEMPRQTGIELAIEVQEECPGCKVLLFSGKQTASDLLHQARVDGHVFDFVPKPLPPRILLAKVREMLASDPNSASSTTDTAPPFLADPQRKPRPAQRSASKGGKRLSTSNPVRAQFKSA